MCVHEVTVGPGQSKSNKWWFPVCLFQSTHLGTIEVGSNSLYCVCPGIPHLITANILNSFEGSLYERKMTPSTATMWTPTLIFFCPAAQFAAFGGVEKDPVGTNPKPRGSLGKCGAWTQEANTPKLRSDGEGWGCKSHWSLVGLFWEEMLQWANDGLTWALNGSLMPVPPPPPRQAN